VNENPLDLQPTIYSMEEDKIKKMGDIPKNSMLTVGNTIDWIMYLKKIKKNQFHDSLASYPQYEYTSLT